MPCRDYESDTWGYGSGISMKAYEELKQQADKLARIACKAMSALEQGTTLNQLLEDPEVSKWWPAHKKADAARQKKEAAEKIKKEQEALLKKEVLAKLTEEELQAFGLIKKRKS
jgi:F0F1-type ATP synthase alpha subunit